MGNKKILLVGGGGHCRSVLDSLLSMGGYDEIGIVERHSGNWPTLLGVPVVGSDSELHQLFVSGWTYAAITLGSVGNPANRRRLYETLKALGFNFPSIIDPTAVIGRDVTLGEGTFVGKQAAINSGSVVGCCAIINTGAIVEHDCSIDDFAHISPGAVLCGGAEVSRDAHVGAGAVIRQGIKIGQGTLIGAGSTVVKDIGAYAKAFGNPCRIIKNIRKEENTMNCPPPNSSNSHF